MADGTISIDVDLNEKAFQASLANMGSIVKSGADSMIKSIGDLSGSFVMLPNTIDNIFQSVPQIINGVITKIASQNPVMTKTGTDFFLSMIKDMPGITENITQKVPGIGGGVIKEITNFMPRMADAGNGFFNSLISDMPDIISKIAGTVTGIATGLFNAIKKENPQMSLTGLNLFSALTNDVPSAIEMISQAPEEIVNSLLSVFNGLTGQFSGIGVNIVTGVWAGISSMTGWLSTNVTGFFQGIISGITGFLGIHSPSALFRDQIGKNIALGISEGISGEMPNVIDDTKKYMQILVNTASQSSKLKLNAGDILTPSAMTSAAINRASSANMSSVQTQLNSNGQQQAVQPEIKVVMESTGAARDVFEALSIGIKRYDYLNGGA
ncbi:MAG: hypothetical protein FWD71_03330 [Oscillospiraceae bacterium]|nr:hypothetical protein [Oscillospiraceae bacterium]